jgi:hypothetical protein
VKHGLGLLVAGCVVVVGCSGAQETAKQNRTFYDWAVATGPGGAVEFEQPYPPLDLAGGASLPDYKGITVLRGGVHLSRPKNWMLRDGNNQPGQAFIVYSSPNAYAVGLYERPDSPEEPWREVFEHYEDDASSVGAKILGGRVPMATQGGGQGRAFSVERQVDATKRPLASHSREYLIRGATRIVLVQVVHEGADLSGIDHELSRVVQTLEVL